MFLIEIGFNSWYNYYRMMVIIMNIFIGCSSSEYISDKYLIDCKVFLEELFIRDNNLIFGVCSKGLMGLSHDIAIKYSRNVKGICPFIYMDQFDELNCTDEEVTDTVGERIKNIIDESDVLLFLPGGIGTMYELFTAIEWKRSYEFDKPIIIYNSCGYYDKMLELLELTYNEDFALRIVSDNYYVCDIARDAIRYIESFDYCKKKVRKIN